MSRRAALPAVTIALLALTAGASFADPPPGPIRLPPERYPRAGRARSRTFDHQTILRARTGFSSATGDFGDVLDTGACLGASAGYGVSRAVLLSGAVAYHRFDITGVAGHVSVTPLTVNADLILPNSGSVVPWIGGGFGVYHVTQNLPAFFGSGVRSENDPGLSVGIGFDVPTSPATLLGGSFVFHHAWGTDFTNADFLALQFDLTFAL
jgi:hypothetical protein